ncbi:hypothetical protein BT69DRAFT_1223552 [Atractiella rhizophila]|nr:hypothetical protein BT69DRAFT_1223552 [Atractiella rhizophila]
MATSTRKFKTTDSTKGGHLTSGIKEDHAEMYEYYDNYVTADSTDHKTRWANQLCWEVARHAVGEEIVVYPLMEKHLGAEGKKFAAEDRADHQKVKERIYKLERMKVGTAEYDNLLLEIMEHLQEHNNSEELNDLPSLEEKLGQEASQSAAASFRRTKKFAPTHAHPSAPNKPPLETLAGFMALPIDKLKDMFMKFPTDDMK